MYRHQRTLAANNAGRSQLNGEPEPFAYRNSRDPKVPL